MTKPSHDAPSFGCDSRPGKRRQAEQRVQDAAIAHVHLWGLDLTFAEVLEPRLELTDHHRSRQDIEVAFDGCMRFTERACEVRGVPDSVRGSAPVCQESLKGREELEPRRRTSDVPLRNVSTKSRATPARVVTGGQQRPWSRRAATVGAGPGSRLPQVKSRSWRRKRTRPARDWNCCERDSGDALPRSRNRAGAGRGRRARAAAGTAARSWTSSITTRPRRGE